MAILQTTVGGAARQWSQPAPPSSAGSLFQLLRDGSPRTRAELAAVTGLARSTISARVEDLLSSKLVAPTGEAVSTGGRPPATFAFNPGARFVLAVDLGVSHARVAVTDLANRVLAEDMLDQSIAAGPVAVLDAVTDVALRLVDEVGRPLSDLAGVGIGLPGPVEHDSGRPTSPPVMPGWDRFDVPGYLRETFPVPILVDNDVNIMALGEHEAVYPDIEDMIFLKIATGIGAGIISDGALQRGAQGAAGDLGHIAVPDGNTTSCTCGNVGCLEAVASGQAVAARLREQGYAVGTNAELVELVRSGDRGAVQAVRQAGRHIGAVLAGCVNMLNPSVIVIGGVVAAVGEHLLAGIRESVYSRSLPLATQHLRIVSSRTEGRAGVLGASTLVTQHALSPEGINAITGAASLEAVAP
ncbi:ROK family transcriptional regulator [Georgenia sp. EYE_87]|uniref:ROK family transcriptional regulator n=1 Tax=Georgenia sp. EYE_87 TaxID=2853448 RepID=UPI002004A42E|nr:ROK family protein [Georgenia sp. EYE_87]MCK6212724.1 ROK family transcriptional regulator [Georgenia sp. EYE_87]